MKTTVDIVPNRCCYSAKMPVSSALINYNR